MTDQPIERRIVESMERGHQFPKPISIDAGLQLRAVQIAMTRLERQGVICRAGMGYALTPQADALLVEHIRRRQA